MRQQLGRKTEIYELSIWFEMLVQAVFPAASYGKNISLNYLRFKFYAMWSLSSLEGTKIPHANEDREQGLNSNL